MSDYYCEGCREQHSEHCTLLKERDEARLALVNADTKIAELSGRLNTAQRERDEASLRACEYWLSQVDLAETEGVRDDVEKYPWLLDDPEIAAWFQKGDTR